MFRTLGGEGMAITSKDLLMLLLGVDAHGISDRGVSGITRLQKFLFLLWKEAGITDVDSLFNFKPYKKGPYSRKLYDDLEFLENMGLVRSEVAGEASKAEAETIEELSFEQLMGSDADPFLDIPSKSEAMTSDSFQERRFTLTEDGKKTAQHLLDEGQLKDAAEGIRRIKSKFGTFSLQDLLYHVYSQYEGEGWTSESDIRDKVLGRKRKH